MSVDCNVYLPAGTDPNDVAKAMAILLGAKTYREERQGSYWIEVRGSPAAAQRASRGGLLGYGDFDLGKSKAVRAKVKTYGIAPTWDMQSWFRGKHYLRIHTAAWAPGIALGIRLARFFGGIVDYNDSDEDGKELRFRGVADRYMRFETTPSGDRHFWRFYNQLEVLQPITDADVRAARKYSAYDDSLDPGAT